MPPHRLVPRLSRTCPPLLTGPALFIVNDGEFKNEDQKGIRRIGISAKASKQSTIGKFGLGLKSVFHWCEAFFYFWSEQDTFEILNPWAGKPAPNHNDWEWEDRPSIPREARQAIVQCLESATSTQFFKLARFMDTAPPTASLRRVGTHRRKISR